MRLIQMKLSYNKYNSSVFEFIGTYFHDLYFENDI